MSDESDRGALPWKVSTAVLGAVNAMLVAFLIWIGSAVVSIDKRLALMEQAMTGAVDREARLRVVELTVSDLETRLTAQEAKKP